MGNEREDSQYLVARSVQANDNGSARTLASVGVSDSSDISRNLWMVGWKRWRRLHQCGGIVGLRRVIHLCCSDERDDRASFRSEVKLWVLTKRCRNPGDVIQGNSQRASSFWSPTWIGIHGEFHDDATAQCVVSLIHPHHLLHPPSLRLTQGILEEWLHGFICASRWAALTVVAPTSIIPIPMAALG